MAELEPYRFRYPTETPGWLRLRLRTRVEVFQATDVWHEATVEKWSSVTETAILLCDLWEKIWCSGMSKRVDAMVPRLNSVIEAARNNGVQIIHSPTATVDKYADTPYRQRILAVPQVAPPKPIELERPRLPFSDSDDCCDTDEGPYDSGTVQHPGITITGNDVISDDGREIYSFMKRRGMRNLIIMGVATNLCVMDRSFGIKQMTKWGVRCILVRDLTDACYNPKNPPYVSHEQGTELVVQHIERHWCPSVLSEDLVTAYKYKSANRTEPERRESPA